MRAGAGVGAVRGRRGSGRGCGCGSVSGCMTCGFLAARDVCTRCKGPVGASAPSLKGPNTPMSDNLLKKRIHYVNNAHFMQNIVICGVICL